MTITRNRKNNSVAATSSRHCRMVNVKQLLIFSQSQDEQAEAGAVQKLVREPAQLHVHHK